MPAEWRLSSSFGTVVKNWSASQRAKLELGVGRGSCSNGHRARDSLRRESRSKLLLVCAPAPSALGWVAAAGVEDLGMGWT
jgi:hypothetical protein